MYLRTGMRVRNEVLFNGQSVPMKWYYNPLIHPMHSSYNYPRICYMLEEVSWVKKVLKNEKHILEEAYFQKERVGKEKSRIGHWCLYTTYMSISV